MLSNFGPITNHTVICYKIAYFDDSNQTKQKAHGNYFK